VDFRWNSIITRSPVRGVDEGYVVGAVTGVVIPITAMAGIATAEQKVSALNTNSGSSRPSVVGSGVNQKTNSTLVGPNVTPPAPTSQT